LGDEAGADLAEDLLSTWKCEYLAMHMRWLKRTPPGARGASVCLCALLAATTLAHGADDVLRIRELGRLALVQLFQRDLVLLLYRSSFARYISATGHASHATHSRHTSHAAHAAHAAEHLREDVVHVRPAAHAAFGGVEGRHAVGVVHFTLVIVGENFVGLFCRLEAPFGFLAVVFCDFVGMVG
jgi:hypothetical protein